MDKTSADAAGKRKADTHCLADEVKLTKQRAAELEQQLIAEQRTQFETLAHAEFDVLAGLFDSRVECVRVCDIERLAYNATSCLDFGRGFSACEIASADLANGYVIALDAGVCTHRPYFKIWRSTQTYKDRKPAGISFGTECAKHAYEMWEELEALVKMEAGQRVDAIFRGVARNLLDNVYIMRGYSGLVQTIAKPRKNTKVTYTF